MAETTAVMQHFDRQSERRDWAGQRGKGESRKVDEVGRSGPKSERGRADARGGVRQPRGVLAPANRCNLLQVKLWRFLAEIETYENPSKPWRLQLDVRSRPRWPDQVMEKSVSRLVAKRRRRQSGLWHRLDVILKESEAKDAPYS
jgi:hypothetical protein